MLVNMQIQVHCYILISLVPSLSYLLNYTLPRKRAITITLQI